MTELGGTGQLAYRG